MWQYLMNLEVIERHGGKSRVLTNIMRGLPGGVRKVRSCVRGVRSCVRVVRRCRVMAQRGVGSGV